MKRALAILLLLVGCKQAETAKPAAPPTATAQTAAAADPATYEKEIQTWRTERAQRLQREDGWLTLVALDWMKEGENTAPAKAGKIRLAAGKATLEPSGKDLMIGDQPVTGPTPLLADADPNGPTVVRKGTVRFNVIKRGDRFAVRVKDAEAPTRKNFKGLESYPIDPKWRVEARLEAYQPPKQIPIVDVTGRTQDNPSPGALVFTIDGKEYRLDPILEEGSDEYFIIFKDETSKDATYQAGRYLYAKQPGPDGKVVVDFNKAYNPPCVFTPFATCPLPPPQNRLPIRVEAGEKRYAGH
jgi:uncharacterized protein (DUF1684 family)